MDELQTMARAKMYLEKLANGVNPLDDSQIPDEDLVNNVRLSRCFFYVADVLRQVIENGGIGSKSKLPKQPFSLPMEKRAAFAFSQEPIAASEIVKRINDLNEGENMLKLTYTMVADWLCTIHLLQTETDAEGKTRKRPTPQGEAMGIRMESRSGMNGPYQVVTYNTAAQHFILDNLDAIIELINEKKENQGKPWTPEEDQQLRQLTQQAVPLREIALILKRNSGAVRVHLRKLGIAYE